MATKNKINLPFGETIKRSFLYTIFNGKLLAKVLSFGLVLLAYEIWSGFVGLQALSVKSSLSEDDWRVIASNLLHMMVSIAVMVNYSRFIILKSPLDFGSLSFFRRVIVLMLAMFIFIFGISIPLTLLFSLVQALGIPVLYLISLLAIIAIVICVSPISLYFIGIAIEDKNMTLREAFSITKGNYNKIFWGSVLIMIPCMIATLVLGFLYNMYLPESYILKLVFSLVFISLSLLDTCLKASYFAHIYQYFTFFKKEKL